MKATATPLLDGDLEIRTTESELKRSFRLYFIAGLGIGLVLALPVGYAYCLLARGH